ASATTCATSCWPSWTCASNRSKGCWPPFATAELDPMQRHLLPLAVFLSGLAAIVWIAAGYLGTNPLALLFTGLVAAGYLAGARELQRYRQATGTLAQALDDAPGDAQALATWLERLHP